MKTKYFIIFILVFVVFQFSKFIKTRIINIDLPKGKIVFTSYLHGDSEIYTMNLNGSGLRRLTKHSIFGPTFDTTKGDAAASFSPEAKSIIFLSDRDDKRPRREFIYDHKGKVIGWKGTHGFTEIYIMDTNGKNQTRLTYDQAGTSAPVFSPDGKKILFYSSVATGKPFNRQIKIVNSDGTGKRTLVDGILIRLSKFSPDSQKVFFIFQGDLFAVYVNSGNLSRLTYFNSQNIERPDRAEGLAYVSNFVLSPDGKEITLVTQERKALQFIFYSMNADGSEMEKISCLDSPDRRDYAGWISNLKYLPDRQSIAFIGDFFTDKIFYILDKNNNLKFIGNLKDINRQIVFTPDNKHILSIAEFPYGLFSDWFIWLKSTFYGVYTGLKYYMFRRVSGPYDNKYLCIMDIDGKNFRKITKLPIGSKFGRDFIHWEK